MPHKTTEVPAELFLSHKGVDVYHCYEDDDIENPPYDYHYVLNEDLGEDESFDIRSLMAWHEPPPNTAQRLFDAKYTLAAHIRQIIQLAIDSGELKPYKPVYD